MKGKRIMAIIGAILLVLLYVSTLIFALMKSPRWYDFFRASVGATILIPVLLFAYTLIYRLLKKDQDA